MTERSMNPDSVAQLVGVDFEKMSRFHLAALAQECIVELARREESQTQARVPDGIIPGLQRNLRRLVAWWDA